MAITLSGPIVGTYDPAITDSAGGFNLLKQIENAYPPAMNAGALRPVTFVAEGTSVGNEAVTIALLAPINLTTLGVVFPADSIRVIKTRVWSRRASAANAGFAEKWWVVNGAATPTIPPESTVTGAPAVVSYPNWVSAIPNNNSASAPEYGVGQVVMDPVATTNVIVGVQNVLGTTNAATSATLIRWKLEVLIDALVRIPTP